MAEHPILFSAPMVRAILAGRKTVTRRIVKPQPPEGVSKVWVGLYHPIKVRSDGEEYPGDEVYGACDVDGEWGCSCPFREGMRLWVRETWCPRSGGMLAMDRVCKPRYRADAELRPEWSFKWRPSIHMPRWASRIALEVIDVRAERLHDITDEDATAEGIHKFGPMELYGSDPNGTPSAMTGGTAREAFALLWESINFSKGFGWKSNPWVWRIAFRVLEAPRAL